MTHVGAWVDLQTAAALPNLKNTAATRVGLASRVIIQSFNLAAQSTALLQNGLVTEKMLGCQRDIFLVPSLWEIAVTGEKSV